MVFDGTRRHLHTAGIIVVGVLTALWGMFKTMANTSSVASLVKCCLAFAVVIAIVGGGGGFLFNKTVNAPLSDPPPETSVGWEPNAPEFTSIGTVILSGTIKTWMPSGTSLMPFSR